MTINILTIEKRKDRRLPLIDHLYDMGCTYQFWYGVDDPKQMGFVNINASHRMIVQDAKDKTLPFVLIAEDDLRFSCYKSFQYYIDNIPPSYDLFFGMIYSGNIQDGRITHGFSGLQLYLIHSRFYDVFLSAPPEKHLDIWLGSKCHKHEYYCCDPFVCFGQSGYSDNFKKQWVFDPTKLPRNLYIA